jgi:hypothetical protein
MATFLIESTLKPRVNGPGTERTRQEKAGVFQTQQRAMDFRFMENGDTDIGFYTRE